MTGDFKKSSKPWEVEKFPSETPTAVEAVFEACRVHSSISNLPKTPCVAPAWVESFETAGVEQKPVTSRDFQRAMADVAELESFLSYLFRKDLAMWAYNFLQFR